MKYAIRLIVLTLALATVLMAQAPGKNVWSAPSNGNWATGANWSLGRSPIDSDTVEFNNTSDFNCTLNTDIVLDTLGAFACSSSYNGKFVIGGANVGYRILNYHYVNIGTGGTFQMTTPITVIQGDFIVGNFAGTVNNFAGGDVYCKGTGAITINKSSFVIPDLYCAYTGYTSTWSGTTSIGVQRLFRNGGTLTINNALVVQPIVSNTPITGTGPINGTASLRIWPSAAVNCTTTACSLSGDVTSQAISWGVLSAVSGTVNHYITGNVAAPFRMETSDPQTSGNFRWECVGTDTLRSGFGASTAQPFYMGDQAAGNGYDSMIFGSSVLYCNGINTSAYTVDSTYIKFTSGSINVQGTGNLELTTKAFLIPGTSTTNITNTCNITSTANLYYDVIVNAPGKAVKMLDSMGCNGDLTLTAGKFDMNGKKFNAWDAFTWGGGAGDTLHCGTAAGTTLRMQGASSALTFGSGGKVNGFNNTTGNGLYLQVLGKTGCTFVNNSSSDPILNRLEMGDTAHLTLSGTASTRAQWLDSVTFLGGNAFHLTNNAYFCPTIRYTGQSAWRLGTNYTIDGTHPIRVICGQASLNMTIPGINAGAGLEIQDHNDNSLDTINITGHLNCAGHELSIISWYPGSMWYRFGNAGSFRADTFTFGTYQAACTLKTDFGQGTDTVGKWDATTYSAGVIDSAWLDSARIRFTGTTWTNPLNRKVVAGAAGRIDFVNAAKASINDSAQNLPVCSLANGATFTRPETIAELLMNRAGGDSLTIQAGTKITINTLDSLDWSGADTSNRNRFASSINDTVRTSRCTLDIPGTRGFAYMRWRNVYSPDTIRCRTGCKSEGGNY